MGADYDGLDVANVDIATGNGQSWSEPKLAQQSGVCRFGKRAAYTSQHSSGARSAPTISQEAVSIVTGQRGGRIGCGGPTSLGPHADNLRREAEAEAVCEPL